MVVLCTCAFAGAEMNNITGFLDVSNILLADFLPSSSTLWHYINNGNHFQIIHVNQSKVQFNNHEILEFLQLVISML